MTFGKKQSPCNLALHGWCLRRWLIYVFIGKECLDGIGTIDLESSPSFPYVDSLEREN